MDLRTAAVLLTHSLPYQRSYSRNRSPGVQNFGKQPARDAAWFSGQTARLIYAANVKKIL